MLRSTKTPSRHLPKFNSEASRPRLDRGVSLHTIHLQGIDSSPKSLADLTIMSALLQAGSSSYSKSPSDTIDPISILFRLQPYWSAEKANIGGLEAVCSWLFWKVLGPAPGGVCRDTRKGQMEADSWAVLSRRPCLWECSPDDQLKPLEPPWRLSHESSPAAQCCNCTFLFLVHSSLLLPQYRSHLFNWRSMSTSWHPSQMLTFGHPSCGRPWAVPRLGVRQAKCKSWLYQLLAV